MGAFFQFVDKYRNKLSAGALTVSSLIGSANELADKDVVNALMSGINSNELEQAVSAEMPAAPSISDSSQCLVRNLQQMAEFTPVNHDAPVHDNPFLQALAERNKHVLITNEHLNLTRTFQAGPHGSWVGKQSKIKAHVENLQRAIHQEKTLTEKALGHLIHAPAGSEKAIENLRYGLSDLKKIEHSLKPMVESLSKVKSRFCALFGRTLSDAWLASKEFAKRSEPALPHLHG